MARFLALTVLVFAANVSLAQENSKVKEARLLEERAKKDADKLKEVTQVLKEQVRKEAVKLKELQEQLKVSEESLKSAVDKLMAATERLKDAEKKLKEAEDKAKSEAKVKEKAKDKIKVYDKDFEYSGKFADTDPLDDQRQGPAQTHIVRLKAGQVYTIDMISNELDSYLRLLDPKGTQLDEDDDSGGNLNSRIIFNCSKDGDYKIVCTTFAAGMTGNYILKVKTTGVAQKPSSAHTQLVEKAAPDFQGDFAVNGDPVKLSDLKGKVVLLCFWEVRSTPSAALLPTLTEWHKAYKKDGLAVVGITFYTSEIGQKLGFDKESGKISGAKEANVKSDQAMLTDFASYHKVDHLLMALNKKEALNVFDVYAVNSVPQLVLIDRKGMVRMINVGSSKNTAEVETELKKLLEEK
jgi:alkyl hydroperoxide reductase subunit AhpC